ncbi:MAG: CHC2 zinc finger domain-containing protein [Acidimicrobiales bacterium]
MGIVDEDIARVREAIDLVQLVAEHTDIKRSGRQWMARCPLHGEKTPSLSVNPEKGVYYCFGCGRSGDAITFVQEVDNLDFAAAVEQLAARAGRRAPNEPAGGPFSTRSPGPWTSITDVF